MICNVVFIISVLSQRFFKKDVNTLLLLSTEKRRKRVETPRVKFYLCLNLIEYFNNNNYKIIFCMNMQRQRTNPLRFITYYYQGLQDLSYYM